MRLLAVAGTVHSHRGMSSTDDITQLVSGKVNLC